YIIASNGNEFWYGYTDCVEPISKISVSDIGTYTTDDEKLQDLFSWKSLEKLSQSIAKELENDVYFKPRRLIGGVATQNEEVGRNTFGATLTTEISPIFNPINMDERRFIAKEGYITSQKRERYVEPIDRIISAAKPASETDAILIEDTGQPIEITKQFHSRKDLEHQIMLIIGSVGSGKTTFIDYLEEKALPRNLIKETVWSRLDMNNAPVSPIEIYPWLKKSLIDSCKKSLPDVDFDDIDIIKKVYHAEINAFNKGIGKLYSGDENMYNMKLAEHIQSLLVDLDKTVQCYMRYCCGNSNKLNIIILDNCDKKTRDEQLLMFEAAQWLKSEYKSLVILPLRDETYDNNKGHPPLDTALKSLVFRIDPPLFQHILMTRVQLALNKINSASNEKLTFSLPNGYTVEYPRSDQAFYLTSIVKSLFEHDRFVRRMIVGLSGRNMRNALEIFLEFCNSAHIGEDQIFKIRQSQGKYTLPLHQVATVLIRMNRRFYDSNHSYVKNLFSANDDDAVPNFFSRFMIIKWLRVNFSRAGTDGLKGYYTKNQIKHALMGLGLTPNIIDREINYLLSSRCIIAEHLRTDYVDDEDLIKLGPAGFVHLDLVGNVSYLAAIAEDTYFNDRFVAEKIGKKIKDSESHLHIQTAVDNATDLIDFLIDKKKSLLPENGSFLFEDTFEELLEFDEAANAVERVRENKSWDPWFDAHKRLPRSSVHAVTVINIVNYGTFVEFNDGMVGLVHTSNYRDITVSIGDQVEVEIIWVDAIQKRMSLAFISVLQEDAGDVFHS
ncbi:S1 RNA-binding domain-containing protein, partial [Vibrio parahaemolyticus]|nr:S1 RNA-binding domain-containing protein [Vibrio parahaemolyticus]